MDTTSYQIEPVTMSEVLEIASLNRLRSSEELLSFIAIREAVVAQQ